MRTSTIGSAKASIPITTLGFAKAIPSATKTPAHRAGTVSIRRICTVRSSWAKSPRPTGSAEMPRLLGYSTPKLMRSIGNAVYEAAIIPTLRRAGALTRTVERTRYMSDSGQITAPTSTLTRFAVAGTLTPVTW